MPFMPEGVIHPQSPCAECGRVMVVSGSRQPDGSRWPGTVTFYSAGMCGPCQANLVRRPLIDKISAAKVSKMYRGPAMSIEDTMAGLDRWNAARRRRLAGSTARQVAR